MDHKKHIKRGTEIFISLFAIAVLIGLAGVLDETVPDIKIPKTPSGEVSLGESPDTGIANSNEGNNGNVEIDKVITDKKVEKDPRFEKDFSKAKPLDAEEITRMELMGFDCYTYYCIYNYERQQ